MRSPSLVNPTTEGVVRIPSELAITTGLPPSMTATTEFVVPKSMPTTLPMRCLSPCLYGFWLDQSYCIVLLRSVTSDRSSEPIRSNIFARKNPPKSVAGDGGKYLTYYK